MKKRTNLGVLLTIFVWPWVYLLVAWARDGAVTQAAFGNSLAFFGMGVVSSLGLWWFVNRSRSRTTRISAVVGYLVLCPFGLTGALFSGLAFGVPVVGTAVYGGIPLVIGTAVGYFLGHRVSEE